MTLDELKANLLVAELELHKHHGFTREQPAVAVALAKHSGASVLPLQVFAEWLRRNPEAVDTLGAILDPKPVGEWTFTTTVTAGATAAKISEPEKRPGVRGATAASVAVDIGTAGATLAGVVSGVRTRPVKPTDVFGLGDGVKIRGLEAVTDAAGSTLQARAKIKPNCIRIVEFLDKRGPVVLARIATEPEKGTVVNMPIEFVEPSSRGAVLAALGKLPGANVETNFSPFEGMADPWTGAPIDAPADDAQPPACEPQPDEYRERDHS